MHNKHTTVPLQSNLTADEHSIHTSVLYMTHKSGYGCIEKHLSLRMLTWPSCPYICKYVHYTFLYSKYTYLHMNVRTHQHMYVCALYISIQYVHIPTYVHTNMQPQHCFTRANLYWCEVHVLGSHLVDSVHCLQTDPLLNVVATAVQSSCINRRQGRSQQHTGCTGENVVLLDQYHACIKCVAYVRTYRLYPSKCEHT